MPSINSRNHPFNGVRYTNCIIFWHFFDYVFATHTIGHDVIGHSDMKNEISRFDKPGTEVRFTLPSTDKKLRPLRCALISYFCVMLRNSGNGNTLNSIGGKRHLPSVSLKTLFSKLKRKLAIVNSKLIGYWSKILLVSYL